MIKKITFLIIDQHSGNGGLEKILLRTVNNLKLHNIDCHILFLQRPTNHKYIEFFENIHVMRQSNNTLVSYFPKVLRRMYWKYRFKIDSQKFLKEHLPEDTDALIILNISKNFIRCSPYLTLFKTKNPHIPIIAWPHGSLNNFKNRLKNKISSSLYIFNHFFAISSGIREELENVYNIKKEKITLIFNPVEKTATPIQRNNTKFIFIGRLDKVKRVNSLLTNLQSLKGKWSLDIYGSTGSDIQDQEFQNFINSLNISGTIIFHGWVNNPWTKVKEAGVLLLNSETEGLPTVLIEAITRGIPCISTDCPTGPKDIITNNLNGWLYPVNKEELGIDILQDIISNRLKLPNQKLIQESGKKFHDDIITLKFINSLEKCIKDTQQNK